MGGLYFYIVYGTLTILPQLYLKIILLLKKYVCTFRRSRATTGGYYDGRLVGSVTIQSFADF